MQTLEKATRELYARLDAGEYDEVVSWLGDDCQVVDELSRSWLRGRGAAIHHLRSVGATVSELRTTLDEISTRERGDCGVVTAVIHQAYRYQDKAVSITSPATIIFDRDGEFWRVAVVHVVPLPD